MTLIPIYIILLVISYFKMRGNILMKKRWTPEELEYLKNNWNLLSLTEIITALDRTEDSITRKARRLNIDTRKKTEDKLVKTWTDEEDQCLINNYGIMSNKEISEIVNRSGTAISKRAKALNISNTLNRWTKKEEIYLEEKWGVISVEAIAKKLTKSKNSILLKAWNMNLRKQATSDGAYLTPPEISIITGISLSTVYSYIRKNKIKHKKFKVGNKMKYQILPKSLLVFLEKYKKDWNTQFADIDLIKSYFSSYFVASGNVIIKENIPEWLINKIIQEEKLFKPNAKFEEDIKTALA